MFSRLLSIAFVGVLAVTAQAQLTSERFSPSNYFGRYHGFGYSDGYHARKEGRCNSWSMSKPRESVSKPWESMSSLYSSTTPSSSNRTVGIQATAYSPMASQEYYAAKTINQSAPINGTERPFPSPNSDESVPPSPIQKELSPSDRGVRALPQLGIKSESIPSSPQVPSGIAPIGSYFE